MIRANMASGSKIPTTIASVTPAQGSAHTNITQNVTAGIYLISTATFGSSSFTGIDVTLDNVAVTPTALVAPSSGNSIGQWYVEVEAGSLSVTINLPDGFSGLTLVEV